MRACLSYIFFFSLIYTHTLSLSLALLTLLSLSFLFFSSSVLSTTVRSSARRATDDENSHLASASQLFSLYYSLSLSYVDSRINPKRATHKGVTCIEGSNVTASDRTPTRTHATPASSNNNLLPVPYFVKFRACPIIRVTYVDVKFAICFAENLRHPRNRAP